MRAENDLSTLGEKVLDGGKSLYDSLVGGNNAVLERNVEVATYKNLLAADFDVFDSFLVVHNFHLVIYNFSKYGCFLRHILPRFDKARKIFRVHS